MGTTASRHRPSEHVEHRDELTGIVAKPLLDFSDDFLEVAKTEYRHQVRALPAKFVDPEHLQVRLWREQTTSLQTTSLGNLVDHGGEHGTIFKHRNRHHTTATGSIGP